METLYSKLYEKYTKLKARKFEELENPIKEQEATFMTYFTAAEELIEHLRSEKDGQIEQLNELRNERNALRDKGYEYEDLLMKANQEIKELKEENERILKPQQEGMFSNPIESDLPMVIASVDNQNGSENTPTRSNNSAKRQKVSHSAVGADINEHPGSASIGLSGKKFTSKEHLTGSQLPDCCRSININSDDGGNKNESAKCIYQVLMESLVGLKLSASNQLTGISISALHESSGYTFSLTWVYKPGEKETELLYEVISLGTLARIAPEWMREEIMFSINMCSIFFERISRFIKFNR